MVMLYRSEGSTRSKYLRGLPARCLTSSVLSNGQVHNTSVKNQEDLHTDVLTSNGVGAIDPNSAIKDYNDL